MQAKVLDPRLGRDFPLPGYATAGSAGLDLRAMLPQDTLLAAGETLLVPTGIALYLGEPTRCGLIVPRSGLGTKSGIVLANLTGVIDSDYQGPIMVPLWNRGQGDFLIRVGMRIAQLLVMPVERVALEVCTKFPPSARGEGGFGSTGD